MTEQVAVERPPRHLETALFAWMCSVTVAIEGGDSVARERAEWNIAGLAELMGLRLCTSALQRGWTDLPAARDQRPGGSP